MMQRPWSNTGIFFKLAAKVWWFLKSSLLLETRFFNLRHTIFIIMLSSLLPKCCTTTCTHCTTFNGNCGFHLRSRSSWLLNHWPSVLLVCCLTPSILALPPEAPPAALEGGEPELSTSLVTMCPDVTEPRAVTGEGHLLSCQHWSQYFK